MALAPRRQVKWTEVRYALNEVAERGKIVCKNVGTTSDGEVTGLATHTGLYVYPVGILLDDVESMNYDRHGEFLQRSVVDVGSYVSIAPKGDFETDMVTGTPSEGDPAYLAVSGYITDTQALDGGTGKNAPKIGYFRTAKNANGFAGVHVDL